MMTWFRAHRRAFATAGHYLGLSPLSSLLSIIAIGIALALPTAGFWLLDNIEQVGNSLSETHEISLFLHYEASQKDVDEIKNRLKNTTALKWRFVSRDEALMNLQKIEGLQSLSSGLPRNPLPDAFIITPRDSTPRAMQDLAQHARTWPMVDTVQHDAAWSGRYHALLRFSRLGLLILAGILALALVAISFNTIRLQILSRQQEIDVAILIGATHPWIARPFLWFGLIEGLLGALFAILLLFGTHFALAPLAADIARSYDSQLHLNHPSPELLLRLIATGTLLGFFGSWLSTRRSLHKTT